MPDLVRLGSVNGGHGIKGWVRVYSYTDPVDAILGYSPWLLKKGRTEKYIEVVAGQLNGKRLVAQLEGIEDRNAADELAGFEIHVPSEALPGLEQGEYYWFQLEGLIVRKNDGTVFGRLEHMLETGANDVMKVVPIDGSVDDSERLIPYVEGEVVIEVDQKAGEIIVNWETDY